MSKESMQLLADDPKLVLSTYLLILTPLALYVYHDILDTRWRPVWRLIHFLIAYCILYIVSGGALIAYIVIQAMGGDYKEVGASFLALILGTYGAWKLTRLWRILFAHRKLVKVLQKIDKSLCSLTGLKPVGLGYHLLRRPKRRQISKRHIHSKWDYETRHDFISSSLFDDDYPGEAAARIRWLAFFGGRVVVLQEDADECASRLALWMRLVLRRPRSEPWKLLTSTSPLVQGHLYQVSLGEALRALIMRGSGSPPPPHANPNPAQELLNGGSLTDVGVGFFWIGTQMGPDEMTEVLSEMPPRWMRGVTQNGKQLMFELVMSLILCEMPQEEDDNLNTILSLPVLEWKRDVSNLRVWSIMSEIIADAVLCVLPRYSTEGEMPPEEIVYEHVRNGVFELKDATSNDAVFQGDTIGLTLIELIRASYRAGYVVEKILGKDFQEEVKRHDWTDRMLQLRLFKAEIVTGLFSVLLQLGKGESQSFKTSFAKLKESWQVDQSIEDVMQALRERARIDCKEMYNRDRPALSRVWYFGDREGQCEHPIVAFATVVETASELSPLVVQMLKSYVRDQHLVKMSASHGDPEKFQDVWLTWKKSQAYEISGSTEQIYVEELKHLDKEPGNEVRITLEGESTGDST